MFAGFTWTDGVDSTAEPADDDGPGLAATRDAERHRSDRREQAHPVLITQGSLRGIDLRYREFHQSDRQ